VAPRTADQPSGGWKFVSNHFLVLLCIAEDPTVRMIDVAARVGITERSVHGIVRDLVESGYVTRTKVGRRNQYEVAGDKPLRHLETEHRKLGELVALISHTESTADNMGKKSQE
jgi:predicted transcriptional regulator